MDQHPDFSYFNLFNLVFNVIRPGPKRSSRTEITFLTSSFYPPAGYSEDSDYTSELSYPVGGQHPNSSASQFRTLANQLTTPPQPPSLENSRESSYEVEDVALDPPSYASSSGVSGKSYFRVFSVSLVVWLIHYLRIFSISLGARWFHSSLIGESTCLMIYFGFLR